ncbi:phenol 2-monooxygenase [Leucosporidium creatinivorum]|uniref:Phenol 2-monooxygenase n=1 Tax=Leucosporidium creatinivorum TaxID=106004 RepID=A0A1Y2FPS7_9BASI|nr:phenol 2-monooxygenase [Leucosporidium creatinivorum]
MSPATPVPLKEYDVIIVGAGPAGLMGSLCSTTYGLSVLHIDERPEPTTAGRADGIQPRTLEVLRNIGTINGATEGKGFVERQIMQGVRVQEVSFWDPTETQPLARTSRAPSCPDFIDVVDNYTLLLHQGLIENAFLDEIENRRAHLPADKLSPAPHGGCFRPYLFETCSSDPSTNAKYPVSATFAHAETKEKYTVRAKYLFGNDGARSLVRRAISGGEVGDGEWQGKIRMLGDATSFVWGVMDVEVKTDFPDIMSKCLIHSKDSGSIMVIPREAGLCRLYVQLQQDTAEDGIQKHFDRATATEEICKTRAQKILSPFKLEFGRTDWFSVYQIGQRIASRYHLEDAPGIYLGGDATHTHSPKAGQGMNISMLDMYSLAWKVNLVEKGMADPAVLLPTYESERRGIAEALLAFDKSYSALFSGKSPKADQLTADAEKAKNLGAVDAKLFIETFKSNAEFASGCGAIYTANILNATPDSDLVKNYPKQGVFNAATKLIEGRRLLPGRLTRAVDANQVDLQQEIKMNGQFRIHVFAGDYQKSQPALKAFDEFLSSPSSFINTHRPIDGASSSIVHAKKEHRHIEKEVSNAVSNPFFTFLTCFSTPHTEWEIEDLPWTFRRERDQVFSDDLFDRRVPEAGINAPLHKKYGVDVSKGAIVVVRPDGYVAASVQLNADGFEALNTFFDGFLTGVKAKL